MLFAAVILAIAAISGAQAQVRTDCVAESNNVNYTYCGRLAVFNIYWTPLADQTNIIFEVLDNGWHALGFGTGDTPMIGANAIFGCDDFILEDVQAASGIEDLLASPWDTNIPSRALADVAAGFNSNLLAIEGTISVTREDGICAIRFERLNEIDEIGVEGQNIIEDIDNIVIVARGAADAPAVHDARAAATQNFMNGVGLISDNPVISLLDVEVDDIVEDSASLASLSTMVVSAVAALTVALW